MNQWQGLAVAAQSMRDAPTEPRAIYRHNRVGPQLADRRNRLPHPSQDNRRSRQHLGYAPDGKVFERREADETALSHVLTADPSDPEIASGALLQCRDQRATKRIAGGFTGNEEDRQRQFGYGHEWRTPTTNNPARSAARITSS